MEEKKREERGDEKRGGHKSKKESEKKETEKRERKKKQREKERKKKKERKRVGSFYDAFAVPVCELVGDWLAIWPVHAHFASIYSLASDKITSSDPSNEHFFQSSTGQFYAMYPHLHSFINVFLSLSRVRRVFAHRAAHSIC